VLAAAIRQGYSALYDGHPEAHQCSDEDLKNFFTVHSTAGEQAITRTVKTFQTLCSMADFSSSSDNGSRTVKNRQAQVSDVSEPLVARPQNIESPAPTLHIDFQVHIAADAPPEQIDKIFESMAKHLYNKVAD